MDFDKICGKMIFAMGFNLDKNRPVKITSRTEIAKYKTGKNRSMELYQLCVKIFFEPF